MSFPYSIFSRIIPHSLSVCNRLLFPPSFVCPLAGLPTVRFGFFSALCSLIEAKKYPVVFPTRHQRRSSQQIRQAAFSFGDICCSAILFYGFHQELRITEILLHKIIRLHIMHPKICFTKFACFFPERLNCSYALLNRNSSLRESKIRITEICSSNPFRKYYA